MSNNGDHLPEEQEPIGATAKVIRALWWIAVAAFAAAVIQAMADVSPGWRLGVSGLLALACVLLTVVAGAAEKPCWFFTLLLVAVAPAVPFAWAALGHAFWQGILIGAVLLIAGVVSYVAACAEPLPGGVK